MYGQLSSSGVQELLRARLAQAEDDLRTLPVTTRQEALAAVYSRLNAVLALGNKVSPLKPILREGPAAAGDVNANLRILNRDIQSIVGQLLTTESDAARLFNLFASTQNSLRQMIRERLYESSLSRFILPFINSRFLEKTTASIDFRSGSASLPLVSEKPLSPDRVLVGVHSAGSSDSSTDRLLDGKPETSFRWIGDRLELVLDFDQTRILNRFRVELIGYQGLTVEEFSSSPDGVLREDLLAEQDQTSLSMDGSSSKFAGDWIADFDPRHVRQLRLILADRAGTGQIALRNVYCSLRQFATTGRVQTTRISSPSGQVVFRTTEHIASELTAATHQISTDGVHFTALAPGQVVDTGSSGFWYRCLMERLDANFEQASSPISLPGEDPALSPDYRVSSSATIDLGGGVIERTLNFERVSGDIVLRESPLEGTMVIYEGTVLLGISDYQVIGSVLRFPSERAGLTLRYQTSAYARAGLPARKEYYSPLLYGVEFEQL